MMQEMGKIRLHEDEDLFREALAFTAARTGFPAYLIEKDYFCTLLLNYLAAAEPGLVFKGGTCLAKVHADFYRLSEDLDFSISVPVYVNRNFRRKRIRNSKAALGVLSGEHPEFHLRSLLAGSNRSMQYMAEVEYVSLLRLKPEVVKIEIGLREPVLRPLYQASAATLVLNPVTEQAAVPAIQISCLSLEEAMAEKLRAALTRREPAIRDFYDLYHAVTRLGFNVWDQAYLALVKEKLLVPDNERTGLSEDRLKMLRAQQSAELEPVLRPDDFRSFDLEGIFGMIKNLEADL